MTRDQLEHAIRAACSVADDTEVFIFGSQAILGSIPDAPEALRTSIEVDIQPKNRPENSELIDGSLGELSQFHRTHGFYVHGVTMEGVTLPPGWQDRTVQVSNQHGTLGKCGYCLEVHDIAASKLAAKREKDKAFVTTLIVEGIVKFDILFQRIEALPLHSEEKRSLLDWVRVTSEELDL